MINVTVSLALTDVPFHFIPKVFWTNECGIKQLSIFWLTGFIQFDNDRSIRIGKELYYQMAFTILCDSYAKSTEIMNIIKENNNFTTYTEKIMDYMDKNGLSNDERDENGLHIICDDPNLNYWQEQKLKNKLTKMMLEGQNDSEKGVVFIDDSND